MVTTGCNIPIFRAGLIDVKLFSRPNPEFKWNNYFDTHDVLAYPIRNMSEEFNVDWINDKKVGVGGLFSSWNPAGHGAYWTDRDVIHPIADEIIRIIAR